MRTQSLHPRLAAAPAALGLFLLVGPAPAQEAPERLVLELPPGGVGELVLQLDGPAPSAAFHRDPAGRLAPLEMSIAGDSLTLRFRDAELEAGPASLVLDYGARHAERPLLLIQPDGVDGDLQPIELVEDERERAATLEPLREVEEGELAAAARNERRLNHPPVGPNPDSAWLSIRPGGEHAETRVELGRNPESDTIELGEKRTDLATPRALRRPAPGEIAPEARRLAVTLAETPLDASARRDFERELDQAAARSGIERSELGRQATREAARLLHRRLERLARERSEAVAREGTLRAEAAAAQRHWRRHLPPAEYAPHVPDARAASLVTVTDPPTALESRPELRGWLRELDDALERAEAEAAAAVRLYRESASALDERLQRLERWSRAQAS